MNSKKKLLGSRLNWCKYPLRQLLQQVKLLKGLASDHNPHEARMLNEMKQRMDKQIALLEERSKVEMEQLRQEKDTAIIPQVIVFIIPFSLIFFHLGMCLMTILMTVMCVLYALLV